MSDNASSKPRGMSANQLAWPADGSVITNAGGRTVLQWLTEHLPQSQETTIVTGYVGLLGLARLLTSVAASIDAPGAGPVRVIIGNEPERPRRTKAVRENRLDQEIVDYWTEQGIDVRFAAPAAMLADMIQRGRVRFRINGQRRPMHAKLYVLGHAALCGSSNASTGGLAGNLEANHVVLGRDRPDELEEYQRIAGNFWECGHDYDSDVIELLKSLFDFTSPEMALARAYHELMESGWASRALSGKAFKDTPLFPHQEQGLDEALYILERNGAVLVADPVGAGKTPLCAALLSIAVRRLRATGAIEGDAVLVLCPSRVRRAWEKWTRGMNVRILSLDKLRSAKGAREVLAAADDCDLLVIDEAHNLVGRSARASNADRIALRPRILASATPMNEAADLLALVELLGLDNQPDPVLAEIATAISELRGRVSHTPREEADHARRLRMACTPMMLRRSRQQIMDVVRRNPGAYSRHGRTFGWPQPNYISYRDGATLEWCAAAGRIRQCLGSLSGLSVPRIRMSEHFRTEKPRPTKLTPLGAGRYEHGAGRGLIEHRVVNALRSSRAAALATLVGQDTAKRKLRYSPLRASAAGDAPVRDGAQRALEATPSNTVRYRQLQEDLQTIDRIAREVAAMPAEWDHAKLRAIEHAVRKHRRVIVFDRFLATLAWLERKLKDSSTCRRLGARIVVAAGDRVEQGSEDAMRLLGSEASCTEPVVVLTGTALREGVNLQRANCVVLVGLPYTPTELEQMIGRIDRIDSPHDEVWIYYPPDASADLPLGSDEKLFRRMRVTQRTVGLDHYVEDLSERAFSGSGDFMAEVAEYVGIEATDALSAVRALAEGPSALIGEEALQETRRSHAKIVGARIAIVPSLSPWGFMCLGAQRDVKAADQQGRAPDWVLFEPGSPHPATDPGHIARRLRDLIRPDDLRKRLPLDDVVEAQLEAFAAELEAAEEELLPIGSRRALRAMRRILPLWIERFRTVPDMLGEAERWDVLLAACGARKREGTADLRSLTRAWLTGLAPGAAAFRAGYTEARPFTTDLLTDNLLAGAPPPGLCERLEVAVTPDAEVPPNIVAFVVGIPPPSYS